VGPIAVASRQHSLGRAGGHAANRTHHRAGRALVDIRIRGPVRPAADPDLQHDHSRPSPSPCCLSASSDGECSERLRRASS
jgi:hypothetical protein